MNRQMSSKTWFPMLCCFYLVFGQSLLGQRSPHISAVSTDTKYDSLFNNSLITDGLIWEDGSGAKDYSAWSQAKKDALDQLLEDMESGLPFPIAAPPELTGDLYFRRGLSPAHYTITRFKSDQNTAFHLHTV